MTIGSSGADEETQTINAYPAVQPAERGTGDGEATGDGRAGVGCAAGHDEQGGKENVGGPAARHTGGGPPATSRRV